MKVSNADPFLLDIWIATKCFTQCFSQQTIFFHAVQMVGSKIKYYPVNMCLQYKCFQPMYKLLAHPEKTVYLPLSFLL